MSKENLNVSNTTLEGIKLQLECMKLIKEVFDVNTEVATETLKGLIKDVNN